MSDRSVEPAESITFGVCDNCAAVHVNLLDAEGEIFASGSLPVELADAFIANFNNCVAQIKARETSAGSDVQGELHNQLAGRIVASIVMPPLKSGGQFSDVLVVLESVIVGVILAGVKLGGDVVIVDALVRRVKDRLAEQRLTNIDPAGRA